MTANHCKLKPERLVTILCPNLRCQKVLAVPEQFRGQRVRCTYCRGVFVVPTAAATACAQAAQAAQAADKAKPGQRKGGAD